MPPVGAAIAGIGSLISGAAAGAAGLAAGAASAVGTIAGKGVSALGGLASGAGGLLFGAPAPGLTVGQKMAAMAEPAYYETAGAGILGGVSAAATSTIDYLGNLIPKAAGIYEVISPPKEAEVPTAAKTIPPVPAPAITKSQLPILGAQKPMILTTGMPAKPEVNYMLYIGLAILALFFLSKK